MRHGLSRILLPLGGLVVPVTNEAVFPMLPIFQQTYGIDAQTANALVPSMILPFAAMMLVAGAITARFGRRRMLLIGFCGTAIGSLMIAFAPEFNFVLAGRVLQGVSVSFVMPGIIASIGDEVEPALRGKTMGIFMLSITVGAALGPAVGGWLSEWGGIAPVGIFLAVVSLFFAVFYWLILEESAVSNAPPPRIGPELKNAYQSPTVVGIGVTGAAIFIALMGCMTFSARVLAGAPFELGPGSIGSLLSVGLAAGILGAIAGGNLTDSSGRAGTTVVGCLIMCIGGLTLIVSAVWPSIMGLPGFVVGLSALGGGHAVSMTALETLSVEVLPDHRDAATSLFNALRFSGYGIAPPLAIWIFAVSGHAAWVYSLLTIALVVGLMYFMLFIKPKINRIESVGGKRTA